jgi:hypothetical protein
MRRRQSYPSIHLEGLIKTTENLSQDGQFPVLRLKSVLPKYELSTLPL